MIHYRDKTYCPFYKDCKKATDCPDTLTQEVKDAAFRAHLPIAQLIKKPKCHTDFEQGSKNKDLKS